MTNTIARNRSLAEASERLDLEIEAGTDRLRLGLSKVRNRRGLTLPSLLAEQKSALYDSQAGLGLHATDYWAQVAEPAAALYREESAVLIDDEMLLLRDSITDFRRSLRSFTEETGRRQRPARVSQWISDALAPLRSAAPTSEPINLIGEQWQQKLHRSAVLRSLPELLVRPLSSADNIISATEMRLLEESPWINGDRLLSAFELATVDIRNLLLTRIEELSGSARLVQDPTEILILS